MKQRRMITIYDGATGEILRNVSSLPDREDRHLCSASAKWCEGVIDASTSRIDPATGEVLPLMTFAPIIGANRISGIPDGTKVIANDKVVVPVDGAVSFVVLYEEAVQIGLHHALYEPTWIQLECRPEMNTDGHKVEQDHVRMRVGAYPPLADFADAMVKGPEAIEDYRRCCQEVKDRFPKGRKHD